MRSLERRIPPVSKPMSGLSITAREPDLDSDRLREDWLLEWLLKERGLVSDSQIRAAQKASQASGLLLPHCLVRMKAVSIEAMLDVLAERRVYRVPRPSCGRGDADHRGDSRYMAG